MDDQYYQETDAEIWSGRVDDQDDPAQMRLHQVVDRVSLSGGEIISEKVILGFASDTGVKRNQGRPGAAKGPDHLRKTVGSLSWDDPDARISDLGNIHPLAGHLEDAQRLLGDKVCELLLSRKKLVVIGGGHETAFGHYLGIADYLKQKDPEARLGIINIDAHFDLRPVGKEAHSGSPFLQAHEHAEMERLDLKYFVYGINPDNNTASLFNTAKELRVRYCTNREVMEEEKRSLNKLKEFLDEQTHIYLTICLDVFDAAIAPGVSAPAWNGISLRHALKVIDLVQSESKIISADICELNPDLDIDNRTARTAGTLFSQLIR